MGFRTFFLIIALLGVAGCESGTSTNAPPQPISPPPNAAAIRQEAAIVAFLSKNYEGWQMQGMASGLLTSCDETDPCNVHISKGKENKVIVLMVKEFTRPDGTTYWLAYEAKPVDLAKARIHRIKEITREQERQDMRDSSERADAEFIDRDYDPRRGGY